MPRLEVNIKAGGPRAHQEEFGHQRAQDVTHWQRTTCQNTQVACRIVSCDASSPGVSRNTPPSTNPSLGLPPWRKVNSKKSDENFRFLMRYPGLMRG